jgi:predicted enzyme related to lactoylglutathione lyase
MPNSIVHFEIPADDVQRAKTFYEKVLGWKISDPWNMNYFMVETKDQGQPDQWSDAA